MLILIFNWWVYAFTNLVRAQSGMIKKKKNRFSSLDMENLSWEKFKKLHPLIFYSDKILFP